MSNYPPGMTREDWKHIDGEQHYRLCPESEDYIHDCSKGGAMMVRPEFSPPCWVLEVSLATPHFRTIRIDYCPWCGEDLGKPNCICTEIAETEKAEAAEHKYAN